MTTGSLLPTLIIVLGAIGVYLLLPHRHGRAKPRSVHLTGAALTALGFLGFLLSIMAPPTAPTPDGHFYIAAAFFYVFSALALGSAVMTIISRNPIHSALWFAGVVLSSAGLFLLAGAQFLAAGTVIIYAGAIIVMFLFVIMLAQMEGRAMYDRSARSPGTAVFTCFLILWSLVYCLGALATHPASEGVEATFQQPLVPGQNLAAHHRLVEGNPTKIVVDRVFRQTSAAQTPEGLEKPDVAGLGESLYTDHLVTVELAGSLLFAALIAAIVIANPKRSLRSGELEIAESDA